MATLRAREAQKGECLPLRQLDAAGVELFGIEPEDALAIAAGMSVEHFVVEVDGEVAVAWGYAAHGLGGVSAYGWMLTTPFVEKHPMRFLRHSARAVEYILRRYPRLEVTVLREHSVSISWLKWLGFTEVRSTPDQLILEKVR